MSRLLLALTLALAPPALADAPQGTADATAQQPVAVDHTEAWRTVLAARRAAHVQNLTYYTARRRFPLNVGNPGLAHTFRDDRGVLCAMAQLIWQSGSKQLVMDVAATNNALVIAEQTDGPLVDWVLTSGLTMEEVAFIQVPGFNVRSNDTHTGGPRRPVAQAVSPEKRALAIETHRRVAHFRMALRQLEMSEQDSLELAMERLGDRVSAPPPIAALHAPMNPRHASARSVTADLVVWNALQRATSILTGYLS